MLILADKTNISPTLRVSDVEYVSSPPRLLILLIILGLQDSSLLVNTKFSNLCFPRKMILDSSATKSINRICMSAEMGFLIENLKTIFPKKIIVRISCMSWKPIPLISTDTTSGSKVTRWSQMIKWTGMWSVIGISSRSQRQRVIKELLWPLLRKGSNFH